jgi:hypothetical protein
MARARRRLSRVIVVAPLLLIFIVDLAIRGGRLAALRPKHLASYSVAMVESALLWGLLLFAASSRKGAFRWVAASVFVVLATVSIGTQLYFYRQYSTYLNLDATLFGTSLSASLFGQLKADGKNFLTSVVPPFLFAVGLVAVGRLFVRPARTRLLSAVRFFVPMVVIAPLLIPCSSRWRPASR